MWLLSNATTKTALYTVAVNAFVGGTKECILGKEEEEKKREERKKKRMLQ